MILLGYTSKNLQSLSILETVTFAYVTNDKTIFVQLNTCKLDMKWAIQVGWGRQNKKASENIGMLEVSIKSK